MLDISSESFYKRNPMSVLSNSNPWKLSTFVLALLLISCIGWFFLKGDPGIADQTDAVENEEVIIPEHDAESARDYSDLAEPKEDLKALKDPIRKASSICKGDSVYKVLVQNSISHSQAYQILREVKNVFDLSRVVPGHEIVLIFSPDNENLIGIEYEISNDDRLIISISEDKVQAHKQHVEKTLPAQYSGLLKQTDHIVQQGDNLFSILRSCGVSSVQIDKVVKAVKEVYNLSGLTAGNSLKIWVTRQEPAGLVRMAYEIDDLNSLDVEGKDGAFKARKQTQELEVRYERAQGSITSSLYESAVQAGLPPEIVMGLTDIFAWDINFFTDIREGDTYTVLYERYYVQNTFKGYGRIMAARFMNQSDEHVAVYYANGKSVDGYYDDAGKPIQKLFLKAPLNYRRISSGFSYHRRHPIFHVMRPHLGVDYAAPKGTPVVSLGQGKVIFKGWSKGFGKCVQVKHPSGYVSYYGHLSGFPKGISKETRLDQGEILGYVGMTGYATGPHLDFRVRLNGKFVNPLTLKPVNGPPLRGKALAHFKEISHKRLAMLDDASLNYTTKLSKRD